VLFRSPQNPKTPIKNSENFVEEIYELVDTTVIVRVVESVNYKRKQRRREKRVLVKFNTNY
jgi:hypothetical protein